MILTDKQLKELLMELKEGLKSLYGSRLKGLYLYGSYARGDQHPFSDLDILIILDAFERASLEIDRAGDLTSDLSLNYDVTVTCFFVTEKDWKTRETSFLANVRDDAVAA